MWQFPCIDWPKIPRTYFARWLKATCWDHFFALCSVAYVQFFLTFSNLLLSAWGRTFPLAGSQPLTFEARFQRPASCATAGIFEILRKRKISKYFFSFIYFLNTCLPHILCRLYLSYQLYFNCESKSLQLRCFLFEGPLFNTLYRLSYRGCGSYYSNMKFQAAWFIQIWKFNWMHQIVWPFKSSLSLTSNAP